MTAFRDGMVTLRKNRRLDGFTESLKEIGYQGVRSGDMVIHAMDAFAGAIGVSDSDGKCTPVYAICRPRQEANPYYYAWVLRIMAWGGYIQSLTRGIRERSSDFRYSEFSKLFLPLPPRPEQDAIVAFLDRKLEEIDRFIAAKKRMIELLEEQKAAMIDRAVTKGLNPNARMKPSGLAWLRDVPAHWSLSRLKHLVHCIDQGSSPLCEGGLADENHWGVLKSGCVNGGVFREAEHKRLPLSASHDAHDEVRIGDVLMSRACGSVKYVGAVGRVRTLTYRLLLSDKTFRLQFRDSVEPDFAVMILGSTYARRQIEMAISGAEGLANNLPLSEAKRLLLALPTRNEQLAIVRELDQRLASRNKTSSVAEREIELMAEYRATLISDAVTGKINASVAVPVASVATQPYITAEPAQAGRTANIYFKRSVFAAEIIHRLHQEPTFGHVKCEKLIFLCEKRCGVDTGSTYRRKAAGPYDPHALRSIDSQIKKQQWYAVEKTDKRYRYVPLSKPGAHQLYFRRYFADVEADFSRVIDTFRSVDTERCEIVATLYSAWEDLLADGQPATDDQIIEQVLEHWHPAKQRIPEDRWRKAIGWMQEHEFVPGVKSN